MSYIDAFNKQLTNLLKELKTLHPENRDLKVISNSLFLLIKSSFKTPIEIFHKHIYIFKEQIVNENEDFFINLNLKGTSLEEFEYIKEIWKDEDDKNRKSIWSYFKVFCKLVEKYNSM